MVCSEAWQRWRLSKRKSSCVLACFVCFCFLGEIMMLFSKWHNLIYSSQSCVESCLGEKPQQPKEAKVLIANPTDHADFTSPELVSSQEEVSSRAPEENEDEPSQEMSTADVLLTERGNYVTQENGKSEILSRQESQTQTFTDWDASVTGFFSVDSVLLPHATLVHIYVCVSLYCK